MAKSDPISETAQPDAAILSSGLHSQRWRRLLPIAFVTYSFAYLDRSNYSIGAAGGLKQALHISFPIWLDDRQQYGRVYTALGLPTTVVIGRDGIVIHGFDGALTFEQMRAAVAGPISAR